MSDELAIKTVDAALATSVQPRARAEGTYGGMALLSFLAQGAGLIAPWWSKRRDADLARFWPNSAHLAGAFYTLQSKLTAVPFRIEPRDASIKQHRAMAEVYQGMLEEESEFGQGWQECWGKALVDFWCADNGFFLEVIGDGKKDGPIVGPAVGLAHLDSMRCTRTGSPEYPVVYQASDGAYYRLHHTRVIFRSQMPSTREDMNGVGYCWVSRVVDVAQNLVDIARYKQEKLGSRPQRGIIVTGGGLDPDVLAEAFRQAEHLQDARGLTRYSKFVVVGDPSYPDARLEMVDLASLPDGFDEETSTTLAMYTIALTGAVPPRWLWPATSSGATKADAMYQHVAGLTGGPGTTLSMIATAIGGSERGKLSAAGKVLPPTLKMVFDFQDDEQDKDQAEVRSVRSQTRERDLGSGVFTVRVVREQALESNDISTAQFEDMELADGRLPDGEPVLALFTSRDGVMEGLLSVDAVGEPMDVAENDAAEWTVGIEKQIRLDTEIEMNAPNAPLKRAARQAIAALEALLVLYKPKPKPPTPKVVVTPAPEPTTEPIDEETPTEAADEETPEEEPSEEQSAPEEKAFAGTGTYLSPAGIAGLAFESPTHAELYAEVDRLVSRMAIAEQPERDILRSRLAALLGNITPEMDALIAQVATASPARRNQLRQTLADLLAPFVAKGGATVQHPFEKATGGDAYGSAIRAAVRGLWAGDLDKMAFIDSMLASFGRRLSAAWYSGAAECGIKPDELSDEEKNALHEMIGQQMQHVYPFADAIIAGNKASGGALAPLLSRAEMWSSRYQDAYTRARAMACGNRKAVWQYADTQHCVDCLRLNGKVKRWSTWNDTILPQSTALACHGFRCQCTLTDTDAPMSKGPLPRIGG